MDQFVKCHVVRHLQELKKIFLQHFPEETITCDWVCNLFSCLTAPFTGKTMEKIIELSSDGNLKLQFINQSTPQQVLDKCLKCISYTCKRSPKEIFAFCNYLPV